MKEHPEPFDQHLRDSLKGHRLTPSDEARKAFLQEAAAIVPDRKKWYKWYYLPAVLVLIFSAIAVIYFTRTETPSHFVEKSAVDLISSSTGQNPVDPLVNPHLQEVTASASSSSYSDSPFQTDTETESVTESVTETETIKQNEQAVLIPENLHQEKFAVETDGPEVVQEPVDHEITGLPMTPVMSGYDTLQTHIDIDSTVYTGNDSTPDRTDVYVEKPGRNEYFLVGLTTTPELMFNTLEGDKFINNFGVEAAFGYGKISVHTGIGVSISKGIVENEIEYNSYLGTYNRLDSISFTFSENSGDFIPELFMSTGEAWDDDASYDSLEIVKRYTYLQVPLTLGFDFLQKEKFSAGVRIGTTMSVLLDSKQLTGNYEPGRNIVIGTSRLTPDRVKTTWLATAGISGTAMLSRKIYLEIEPQARYYYGSVYEDSGKLKKPWSVGVRLAISYKF